MFDGCFASGEFPTFAVKKNVASPQTIAKYIVHCVNSPRYLAIVDAKSTGSTKTSRNRFNQELFLKMTIQIPENPEAIAHLVNLMDRAEILKEQQKLLLERTDKLREELESCFQLLHPVHTVFDANKKLP